MEQTPTAAEYLIEKNMATDAFVSNGIYTYRVSELMESYAKEHALRFADHCLKHPDWEKEDEEIYMEWAEKLTAEEQIDRAFSVLGDGWFIDPVMNQMHKECNEAIESIRKEDKPPINFWTRLKDFIEDVQVNDPASEEEKAMIVHVCNEFTKKQ